MHPTSIFYLIFFILVAKPCFGQELPPKYRMPFDFSTIEAEVSKKEKWSLLRKIAFYDYLHSNGLESISSSEFDLYHVLDINADGKLDVIYDGRNPSGIETNNVVFFLNQKDALIPVIKLNGDFTNIYIEDNQLQCFQLIKYPCCAAITYLIEEYRFSEMKDCYIPNNRNKGDYQYSYGELNESIFCVDRISRYAFVKQTKFPNEIHAKGRFTVTASSFLTPKPFLPTSINFEEDETAFHYIENKAIAKVSKGSDCYVLAEEIDDQGNVFYFVLILLNDTENSYFLYKDREFYGWLKKEDLRK